MNGDKVAVMHVTNLQYHKLPGGGVEEGESLQEALHREILEEAGCRGSIVKEIGEIVELRDDFEIEQHSYCYLMSLAEENLETHLDDEEEEEGFQLEWYLLDDAIALFRTEKPEDYEARFINLRDVCILEEAKKLI